MRTEEIHEPVDVGVLFRKDQKPVPKWFRWGGRKHDVERVEMSWKSHQGESPLLFFSVTAGGSVFELSLDQKTLHWTLEKVHVD
jgi:hypothetical protein